MTPLPAPSLRTLLLGLALLLLGGCGVASVFEEKAAVPPGGPGDASGMSEGERAWALEILDLLNAERAAHDLEPIAWSEEASEAAYGHSWDMDARRYFDHVNPDGDDPGVRMQAAGVEYLVFGENIAKGYESPQDVMTAWMNSEGHRANILLPRYTHVGIGIHSREDDGPWWTQDFFE